MMIAEYKVPVLCGIKTDKNKQVIFNWDADDEDDIIHLASDIAAKYDEDGV